MQRNNAKDDTVEGEEDGERPPSSQPIAPAAGQAPPQPAEKSIAYSATVGGEASDCDFLFEVLAEKHNAVIRKIREIPPWEWEEEFLELEPQVLRFLGTFAKRYPECAAFKTAYTLASAFAVYRLTSRKPKNLTEQDRATCIAANRDLVDEYSVTRRLHLEAFARRLRLVDRLLERNDVVNAARAADRRRADHRRQNARPLHPSSCRVEITRLRLRPY